MGNFIISITLIGVLLVLAGLNSFFICSTCDNLLSLIEENDFESARALWEKKRDIISLSVRDSEIDAVNSEFSKEDISKSALSDAINELKHSEKTTLLNVFMVDIQI